VYDKAKAGDDFAQLAVTYSRAHRTSKAARSAGAAARSCRRSSRTDQQMKAGDVSEPIRTPSGFHLFRLNEVRGGAAAVRDRAGPRTATSCCDSELEDDQTGRAEARAHSRARA
jgi:peptidyl-prolyl cis-trans isomerase SurA